MRLETDTGVRFRRATTQRRTAQPHRLVDLVITTIHQLARTGALPSDLADVPLAAGTCLDSLGLDSMARIELLAELEERADVTVPESMVSGIRTVEDLAHALGRLLEAA